MATIEEVQAAIKQWERYRRAKTQKKRGNRINYTRRAQERIVLGVHPLAGRKLADNGETCGSCGLAVRLDYHSRAYWKCEAENHRYVTHSEATDIRLYWPACRLWQPSPDTGPGATLADLIGPT